MSCHTDRSDAVLLIQDLDLLRLVLSQKLDALAVDFLQLGILYTGLIHDLVAGFIVLTDAVCDDADFHFSSSLQIILFISFFDFCTESQKHLTYKKQISIRAFCI